MLVDPYGFPIKEGTQVLLRAHVEKINDDGTLDIKVFDHAQLLGDTVARVAGLPGGLFYAVPEPPPEATRIHDANGDLIGVDAAVEVEYGGTIRPGKVTSVTDGFFHVEFADGSRLDRLHRSHVVCPIIVGEPVLARDKENVVKPGVVESIAGGLFQVKLADGTILQDLKPAQVSRPKP